jgi:hypothetical protein
MRLRKSVYLMCPIREAHILEYVGRMDLLVIRAIRDVPRYRDQTMKA